MEMILGVEKQNLEKFHHLTSNTNNIEIKEKLNFICKTSEIHPFTFLHLISHSISNRFDISTTCGRIEQEDVVVRRFLLRHCLDDFLSKLTTNNGCNR